MDQGIGKLVDHSLVEFSFFTADLEDNLLTRREAKVTDNPSKPLKEWTYWYHPGIKNPFLEAIGNTAEAVNRLGERLELLACFMDYIEFILNGTEVITKSAEVNRPTVKRTTGRTTL